MSGSESRDRSSFKTQEKVLEMFRDMWDLPFHPPGPAYDAHLSFLSAMAVMLKHYIYRATSCIRHILPGQLNPVRM
jgi:hypothetical protein